MNERTERGSIGLNKSAQNNENEFFGEKLKSHHIANLNCIIIAQINIHSLRNRFDAIVSGIRGNLDILIFSKTGNS